MDQITVKSIKGFTKTQFYRCPSDFGYPV